MPILDYFSSSISSRVRRRCHFEGELSCTIIEHRLQKVTGGGYIFGYVLMIGCTGSMPNERAGLGGGYKALAEHTSLNPKILGKDAGVIEYQYLHAAPKVWTYIEIATSDLCGF